MAAGVDRQDLGPINAGVCRDVIPLELDRTLAPASHAAPGGRREAGTTPAGARRPVPRLQGIDTP